MSTFGAGDARSDRRRDCDFRIRRGARAGRVRQAYLQCSSTQRTSPARAENPHEREKESQKRLACVSLEPEPMKKRKKSAKPSKKNESADLQGPPARETVVLRSDREREAEEELRVYTSSSPRLTAGDVDADWQRADSVGEEAPGGTVATPDQSVVDDLGAALGVQRAPDEEFRPSAEILERRDRRRREEEE